jgi:hypothetical protein
LEEILLNSYNGWWYFFQIIKGHIRQEPFNIET